MAIDLNYSGLGSSGNQFAPNVASLDVPAPNIAIVFGADGTVISTSQTADGIGPPPAGQIFFCIGDTDGVRTDNLFSTENRATANLMNPDSIWLVINPSTGRVVSSPFASVSTIPASIVVNPSDNSLDIALNEARIFALLSDTVDLE
jgi:hypothetical protein